MSLSVYGNMNIDGVQKISGEDGQEMTYANADSHNVRVETEDQQTPQCTGKRSERKRSHRSASVCLGLLCVLLLAAVIVLCVQLITKMKQFHIKSNTLTEEKDQLLITNIKLTEERQQLLNKNINLIKERDGITKENHNQIQRSESGDAVRKLNQEKNELLKSLHEMDGWICYQSNFYYISSEKKSWSESRRYCIQKGADLLIINHKNEQDFLYKFSGEDKVWIGLTYTEKEGTWKWVNGSTLTSGFWKSGQPDGQRQENCALTVSSGWHDYPCSYVYKWICEKSILK
ncbi:CD209 antigen-like protein E [Myxocyprinus asiaticus]|uniref:CD209 antigen-like protein E n=1 Tax=Myxocyprinus asiaticus TaxID=70543 RepID=UPI00222217D2|nr:CD209 antigen-like protein E [Myxocyprinus asiaticus]